MDVGGVPEMIRCSNINSAALMKCVSTVQCWASVTSCQTVISYNGTAGSSLLSGDRQGTTLSAVHKHYSPIIIATWSDNTGGLEAFTDNDSRQGYRLLVADVNMDAIHHHNL
ncbi:hypothetical protein J6590_028468 [Homalodisca vitripennis]|nr:hypothetical protein J6590_028468 [Homalodisca vitripennis]